MTKFLVSAMALAALAGAANAQVPAIEFQVVERTGQTTVTQGGDVILDFAVRARVTSTDGSFLGGFGFNVAAPGEADTNGTLRHGTTMDPGGSKTYFAGFGASGATPTVGVHGLSFPYTYLAALQNPFNGVVNSSNGTFTNSPGSQEIGLITGSSLGTQLMGTPGVDPLLDGNPATYTPYGVGDTPANGATAPMDPAVGSVYFAQGAFVDIFRFRYTVTNFAARTVQFTLQNVSAQIANSFLFSNSAWGLNTSTFTGATVTPSAVITIVPIPAPASAALLGLGGLVAVRRRRMA